MKRFAAMRDEQASREPWLELRERFDRYLLDEVVDQLEASLLELDYLLHDTDESSLLTRSENAGISLIMSGMPWLDTWKVSDDDVKRVSRLEKQLGDKAPPTATDEDWSHVQAFRRAVLLSESCRIHAAFLKLGRDADAMKVAEAQIATDADGTSRMALAAVAWGAGVADERHAAWVEEARALGADDAGLGARLGARRQGRRKGTAGQARGRDGQRTAATDGTTRRWLFGFREPRPW
jgi:hypothetical protein